MNKGLLYNKHGFVIFKFRKKENEVFVMSKFSYKTHGVCSTNIDFEIDNGVVKNVSFTRGCNGNTSGIAKLVDGMRVDEVIDRLKNTDCNARGTSCPDQLARALEDAKKSL